MVSKNNQIFNSHFRKHWIRNVKTWFDQPANKLRRLNARKTKAIRIAPRPVSGLLRPVVHSMTQQYNSKIRAGRGFTLDELKEAGVNRKVAQTIGIAVDHRRTNKSVESLQANVARLKAYKSKLIVLPKKHGHPKSGDSTVAEAKTAKQLTSALFPIAQRAPKLKARAITPEERKKSVFWVLRQNRANLRLAGARQKKAAEKAASAALLKKSDE